MGTQGKATKEAVAKVCDELTARGERPTQERIRQLLGGSPNTISIHLDAWWGAFLERAGIAEAPPQVAKRPEEVQVESLLRQVMDTAKEQALKEANRAFDSAKADMERRVTEAAARSLEANQRREEMARMLAAAQEQSAANLRLAQERAEQAGRVERLLNDERDRVGRLEADVRVASEALAKERDRLAEANAAHRAQVKAMEEGFAADRKGMLLEVDRARRESATTKQKAEQLSAKVDSLKEEAVQANAARQEVEVKLAEERTRVTMLVEQLTAAERAYEALRADGVQREARLMERVESLEKTVSEAASRGATEGGEAKAARTQKVRASKKGAKT